MHWTFVQSGSIFILKWTLRIMESKGPELSVYIMEVSITIIELQITCIIILVFLGPEKLLLSLKCPL